MPQSLDSPELTHRPDSSRPASAAHSRAGSDPGARGDDTHTVHRGLEVLKYNWVTVLPARVGALQVVFEDLKESSPKSLSRESRCLLCNSRDTTRETGL